jgi:hypothetical protein
LHPVDPLQHPFCSLGIIIIITIITIGPLCISIAVLAVNGQGTIYCNLSGKLTHQSDTLSQLSAK